MHILVVSLVLAVLLPLIAMAVVQPQTFALPLAVATSVASFGAAPLFVVGLKGFTRQLRRACTLLCFGIILYGLGQLQFPLFQIIDGSFWVNSGAVILPYMFAIGLIFFGMRRLGKLLGLKTLWMSPIAAVVSAIVVAALIGFLASGSQVILLRFETFLAVVLLFATLIAWQCSAVAATRYRPFLHVMTASLAMLVFTAAHHVVITLWLPQDIWYITKDFTLTPALLSALLFLWAGYLFARIHQEGSEVLKEASPVDVVTYVAGLASRPSEIDTYLDGLRNITATVGASAKLSPKQHKELASVYQQLERYLVEREPLQRFTKDDLRERVRVHFQFTDKVESAFWILFKE